MVKKKYQSKRMSLHKKYKIVKKVREHKRQERKKDRANQHKKKKDPGIPNNWPFKEELLQQVEQARLAELESKRQAQQQRKEDKKDRKRAEQIARANGGAVQSLAPTPLSVEMQSKKDLKETVKKADLVLIVLDARDPQGSRSLSLEDGLIGKAGKKVVLVLNKVDLISTETAQKWVNYLRRFHPTIPVRALNEKVLETKKKSRKLQGQKALYDRSQELTGLRDNGFVEPLRHFLDEYSESRTELTTVAILGYPNVGKSTVFNSIKKRPLATVDKLPLTTKTAQEAQYNDKLVLVDCPPLDVDYSAESSIVLRHGVAGVWLEDPVPVVRDLLERGDGMNLMQHLQIPVFKSHEDFIAKLAVKKNLIRKGGDPDILQTARGFLRDLGNGAYSTSCLPPAKSKSRFDMPEWYTQLKLAKFADHESALFLSNPSGIRREIVFTAAPVAHAAGDTTEFDLVMGQLPENEGLTSEDEDGDEEMEEGDDAEEDEEEDDEDDE